jgi:hypothetical protein
MNRLPANHKYRRHAHRWTRYEKAQPGHRLQVDVKFLERIPGTRRRFYQFTAIDDCTRSRVLKVLNYHRPHGALAGQTPYEWLLAKARAGTSPAS